MGCWYRSREPRFGIGVVNQGSALWPRSDCSNDAKERRANPTRGYSSHAPRDLEEQPATERDADRPEDEGISEFRHQIRSHASEKNALPMKPAASPIAGPRKFKEAIVVTP